MYNFPKIKFGEKEFYVVDRIDYKGVEYLYIYEDVYKEGMDITKFEGDVEMNFIYKLGNGKYENVVDSKLFDILLQIATKRLFLNNNPYMQA